MRKYEIHPAAELFPLMTDEELTGLVADIRDNGQREPITIWNGKLVDGRNRLAACDKLGIEPDACELDSETDPIKWVLSHNLHRRHLTTSQRAMVGERLAEYYSAEAKERQKLSDGRGKKKGPATLPDLNGKGDARDKAAAAVGVSGKMIDAAKKVRKKGTPELNAAVTSGKVTASRAAKIADAPKEQQAKLIAAPKKKRAKKKTPEASTLFICQDCGAKYTDRTDCDCKDTAKKHYTTDEAIDDALFSVGMAMGERVQLRGGKRFDAAADALDAAVTAWNNWRDE